MTGDLLLYGSHYYTLHRDQDVIGRQGWWVSLSRSFLDFLWITKVNQGKMCIRHQLIKPCCRQSTGFFDSAVARMVWNSVPNKVRNLAYMILTASTVSWRLGGFAVRTLDTRPKGARFNAQPMHYQVTVLGKLFTPTCPCRCKCLVVSVDS